MLIQALNDYYDILAAAGEVLPDGYSNVKVHYLVSLTGDGVIDEIINCQDKTEFRSNGGKIKEKYVPKNFVFPLRTEKPGIDANIAEHRPLYIFGLNFANGEFRADDAKARKSHEAFVRESLDFLKGLDSPLIQAYRAFITNWKPEEETQNPFLLKLGKSYGSSGYAFCLSGYPEKTLHDDPVIKKAWESRYRLNLEKNESKVVARCAVTGETAPIARIHNKIRGVYGGLATGTVLVGYNNPSEESYGNEQAYNSCISEEAMKRYTEALNYLLSSGRHKIQLDDTTVIFWAMGGSGSCEEMMMAMLCGSSEKINAEQTEEMLGYLLRDAKKGNLSEERLRIDDVLQSDVSFYMVGLKPNSGRLSVKFIYRKRFADMIWNIARFQRDIQVSDKPRTVSLKRVQKELLSAKSATESLNPALLSKLFEAMLTGGPYPTMLLETAVRRVRTDADLRMSAVRAGLIKACINRNYQKEEIKVALDKNNHGQAYLCGRLFAVLEKLQRDASGGTLNRTIKDAYFASASAKPALVFPKLLRLAQNHLGKADYSAFYNRLIGEITDSLNGEFPDTLLLPDQGRFMIGYYQQYQSFFSKNEQEEN